MKGGAMGDFYSQPEVTNSNELLEDLNEILSISRIQMRILKDRRASCGTI